MAGPDRRGSTELDRRASTWSSVAQRDEGEYDLDAAAVSDGFRPSNTETSETTQTQIPQIITPNHESRRVSIPPPRPSSTTKPKSDSFALRHDGGNGHITGNSADTSSSDAGPSRRSSTSTDTAAFVRFDGPYQGPTGPSFPYQMFPQDSSRLARTASVMTESTVRVPTERSYAGPTGPTHPYGMYPQNTVPEPSVDDPPRPPPIPVGFPGSNNEYRRRIGPDGEEIGDIIGPDGHTEQLPPYTKYPDEAFARKARSRPQIDTDVERGPVEGAGGIGLATRNPEFSSQEDLNSPQSRQSIRSVGSDPPVANDTDGGPSEKPELKKWQKIARRKVWRIVPVWAFVLAGIILLLFGIILGAVFAALGAEDDGPPPSNGNYEEVVYTTLTTTYDATPFTSAPPNLSPLPTGTYALPITAPSAAPNGCFLYTEQSKAWSCSIPDSPLQVQVYPLEDPTDLAAYEMVLDFGNETLGNTISYGTQPPTLDAPQLLNLVLDSQDPTRGPAWFFQTTYNKVVVVEGDLLSASSNSKRDEPPRHYDDPASFSRKGLAQSGDTPWFCHWNDTLIEAFLYINLKSSEAIHSAQHSIAGSTGTAAPSSTLTLSVASQTLTSTGSESTVESSSYGGSPWPAHDHLTAYPKVLKLQERRYPNGPNSAQPYCVQKRITSSGALQDVLGDDGLPNTIFLTETIPDVIQPFTKRDEDSLRARLERRVAELEQRSSGSCGCVWLAS